MPPVQTGNAQRSQQGHASPRHVPCNQHLVDSTLQIKVPAAGELSIHGRVNRLTINAALLAGRLATALPVSEESLPVESLSSC